MALEYKIVPEKIHLNQILFIKDVENILDKKLSKRPVYDLVLAHNTMHNLEKEFMKIRLFIELFAELDGEKLEQNVSYEFDFFFHIENMNDHYRLEDGVPTFRGELISTLLAICYSTTRGILLMKWQHSVFQDIILPVTNIPNLMNSRRPITTE